MQYRVGTCGSCGASFKVPAAFQGDKAKCKSCEAGVVAIGPVQEDTPAPAPAEVGNDEGFTEYVPSGRRREAQSMLEKLRAGRAEESAPPVPAKRTAARAKGRPVAKARGRTKPDVKPEANAEPKAKPARRARAGKAQSDRKQSAESDAKAKPAGRRARAGASSRSSARRAGGGSRRGDRPSEDDGSHMPSGDFHPKKSSPAPMIAIFVVLIVAAFGVWKFVLQEENPVDAASGTGADTEVAGGAGAEAPEGGGDPTTDEGADTPDGATGDTAEDGSVEIADHNETDPDTTAAEETDSPIEASAPAPKKPADPSSVDLSLLEPFGPASGTSDEEWTEIQELVLTHIDLDAGAAGNRAGNALEQMGKPAFPAILNVMLKLDYSSDEGYRNGDLLQKRLQFICNGRNVGWRYSTVPEDVLWNKKAVALLHKVWSRAKDDQPYWLYYSKQEDEAPKEEVELSDEDLGDLDDLDDLDG